MSDVPDGSRSEVQGALSLSDLDVRRVFCCTIEATRLASLSEHRSSLENHRLRRTSERVSNRVFGLVYLAASQ